MNSKEWHPLGHCRWCNEEVFGYHRNKLIYHQRICLCNPDRQKWIDAIKRGSITMNRKSNAYRHQLKCQQEATRKDRFFKCKNPNCSNTFSISLTDQQYDNICTGKLTSYRKYCYSCQHAHVKHYDKYVQLKNHKHISNVHIGGKRTSEHIYNFTTCPVCKRIFMQISSSRCCSNKCKHLYKTERYKYISAETHLKLSIAARKSVANQFNKKRSQCEIEFCSLCEMYFDHVEHNKPYFNGWDSDVLLFDSKIAIQWNGPWHYKQISTKPSASLKAIKNRDEIKKKEILEAGWSLYIIKDVSSHKTKNKMINFVKNHFDRFVNFIQSHSEQFYEEFELI